MTKQEALDRLAVLEAQSDELYRQRDAIELADPSLLRLRDPQEHGHAGLEVIRVSLAQNHHEQAELLDALDPEIPDSKVLIAEAQCLLNEARKKI